MAIQWRDTMSVANSQIDDDHKRLIQLINLVEKQIGNPEERAPLLKTFAQLKNIPSSISSGKKFCNCVFATPKRPNTNASINLL